jgi:hypothetical protein
VSEPYEYQQLQEQVTEDRAQIHDPAGDKWQRHADGPKRDRAADREIRAAIAAEARGEVDPATGQWRPCTWEAI